MAAVVFTDPQAARVGLTEQHAREAARGARIAVISPGWVLRNGAGRDSCGLIKPVASQ